MGGGVRQVTGAHDAGALNRDVLYVAARAPRPGFTKSRLGHAIGHEKAAALYAAFVQDLAARLSKAPFRVGWYFTPDDGWGELEPLASVNRQPWWSRGPVLSQPPGDWTHRQRALFLTAASRNEHRIVLIASDSPQLGLDTLTEAFERLDRDDLVLGPTDDGGYYLIAMRSSPAQVAAHPSDVLSGVRMSTGTVLDEILARSAMLGLRASLLASTFDIDEATDLQRLIPPAFERDDLTATRTALVSLGLVPIRADADERLAPAPVPVGGVR
jgi:rSAM/selenodomain-associated transferase 1